MTHVLMGMSAELVRSVMLMQYAKPRPPKNKQIGSAILPADLRKAVDYAWKGLKGAGSWMGFALAAAFFAAEEFDFGEQMCMVFGYIDMGLGYAVMAVTALDSLRDMIPV